jgi:hypothetical protein
VEEESLDASERSNVEDSSAFEFREFVAAVEVEDTVYYNEISIWQVVLGHRSGIFV